MKRARFFYMAIATMLLVALAGCATMQGGGGDNYAGRSHKVLASAKVFYDEGLRACADAYSLGLIDAAQKQEMIKAGEAFSAAWQAAADSLYAFAVSRSDQATVEEKFALMQTAYLQFTKLARPYLVRALTK